MRVAAPDRKGQARPPGRPAVVPEGLRLGLALAMLLGAAVLDLRSRRVGNPYWVPFVLFAAVLLVSDAVERDARDFLWRAGAGLATCGFLYGAWYLGAFGGADAKGLMVLAWLWPARPDLEAGSVTPAVDALVNGTLLMLLLPVVLAVLNLLRGRARLPALFLGTPMAVARARRRHVWPMQRMGDAGLVWRYWQQPTEDLRDAYDALEAGGVREVWVTPKVPFMAVLPVGLLLHALFGNLVFHAMARLIGT